MMWKFIAGWASSQVRSECEKLRSRHGLPLSELLPAARVEQAFVDDNIAVRIAAQ